MTESVDSDSIDLKAYLKRIGYNGDLQPSEAVLQALHQAHATHIPFENLNILLGRPIRLDLESLQSKLVTGQRGGYCFEQNLLFSRALQAVGFSVTQLAARVRVRTHRVLPRTHMALLVHIGDESWLADVGFGGGGLLQPVPFRTGAESRQFAWTYRLVEEADQWILQSLRDNAWEDLYAFTLERQLLPDYEMANYYVSTHPESRFVQTLTAQCIASEARYALINRELTTDTGQHVTHQTLASDEELLETLEETFNLRFPPGTKFNYDPPT
jgi:N-hydroxyarylamine O-acetyltransferase